MEGICVFNQVPRHREVRRDSSLQKMSTGSDPRVVRGVLVALEVVAPEDGRRVGDDQPAE